MNLNQKNFELNYTDLNNYLLDNSDNLNLDINITEFLTTLKIFRNITNEVKNIIEDSTFLKYLNNLLLNNNFELKIKLSYFIACYMKALDLSEEWSSKDSIIKFKEIMMDIDLNQYKEQIKNIIFFNTFFSSKTLKKADENKSFGKKMLGMFASLFISKEYLPFSNDFYEVEFTIYYNHNDNYKSNCFKSSNDWIFQLFTFFKIRNVEIDQEKKKAEIYLDSINRKEILEEKIYPDNDIIYNIENNVIEIKL